MTPVLARTVAVMFMAGAAHEAAFVMGFGAVIGVEFVK